MGPISYTIRLERLARDKHSTLLGPLVSYEENEVLWIPLQECARVGACSVLGVNIRLDLKSESYRVEMFIKPGSEFKTVPKFFGNLILTTI